MVTPRYFLCLCAGTAELNYQVPAARLRVPDESVEDDDSKSHMGDDSDESSNHVSRGGAAASSVQFTVGQSRNLEYGDPKFFLFIYWSPGVVGGNYCLSSKE